MLLYTNWGHALAARRYGISTERIILSPIGGIAQLKGMPDKPLHELVVAIAGPMVNVVIAIVLFVVCYFLAWEISLDDLINPVSGGQSLGFYADKLVNELLIMNIVLVLFNAIPAFPMDGGRVLRALLAMKWDKAKATRIASMLGQVFALGFVMIGIFYNPMLAVIGVFIYFAAVGENKMVRNESLLKDYTVANVIRQHYAPLPEDMALVDALKMLVHSPESDFVVVNDLNELVGIVSRKDLYDKLKNKTENLQSPVSEHCQKDIPKLKPTEYLKDVYPFFHTK